MAISIDWPTKVITVPKADTQLILAGPPQEVRQLDVDWFRLQLKAIEASPEGMPFIRTHNHNTTVTVGGVILARVVELINGYTVTFEDGQYAVNLVGANNNIADVTNVNQVSIRSTNSAGLQDLSSLQAASFQGFITIDIDNGVAGTLFPIGTAGQPVNNLTDAVAIANERGIRSFSLRSDVTLDQNLTDFAFEGFTSHLATTVDINNYNLTDVRFTNTTITGDGSGSFQADDCKIMNLDFNFLDGAFNRCGFADSVTMVADGSIVAVHCFSEVAGSGTPFIHMGTTGTIQLRGYNGGMEIRSFESGNVGSIDLASGHIVIAASCTGGTLVTRGVGHVTRLDGGAVTVVDTGLVSDPTAKLRYPIAFREDNGMLYEE